MTHSQTVLIKKSLILFTFSFLISFQPFNIENVLAEELKPSGVTSATVATVNIYNAKIVSKNGNTINISFDISNREGIQSGIKYSVMLTKSPNGETVDQFIYPEVLELGSNQTITKNISYSYPPSLSSGNYQIWIKSSNAQGLSLAIANLGEFYLEQSKSPRMEILTDSCYLTVKNETSNIKYSIIQGVDISADEILVVNCKVFSNFLNTIEVMPSYETYFRTVFGEKVQQIGGSTSSINIKAGTSTLSLELPKANKPQAYDVTLSLKGSATGDDIIIQSNQVKFHYVLQGASGTIQNTVFDKTFYLKGETANLRIFFTPSADMFSGSRIASGTSLTNQIFEIKIIDEVGTDCGQIQKQITDGNNVLDILVKILNDCTNPKATVTYGHKESLDAETKTLDSAEFKITTPQDTMRKSWSIPVIFTSIILLVAAVIILIFNAKTNKKE